ncbi:hypothetical protein N7456_010536 [Penicillium angulare]|uniref:Uncharacterized protein n=1 Tax=Penicillium angulare TaxID=116970 RepID=A0A9W9F724_9EURO|nr:hypothetical protein N7456_010536 [Penicillium angulare]
MQSPSEAPIKAKSTSKLEKINNSISEALSQYNGTIRILGDIPTERLDPENYLSSTQSLIKELTTYWETKATLRLLAIEIYPIHSYFALDFNNEKYDYQTADKDMSGNDKVRIASSETTGEHDFKYEEWPNVCAVLVDKSSGLGYAQITGGGKEVQIMYTGRGETGYVLANISSGQSCMLYGNPTVLWIYPCA